MLDKSYITEPTNFADIWFALEQCEARGIHILDDDTGKMNYISYASIVEQAGQLAVTLSKEGIVSGQKVLLSAKTTPKFPVLWMALVWLGATPVPLPPQEVLVGKNAFKKRLIGIVNHFPHYICHDSEVTDVLSITSEYKTDISIIPFSKLIYAPKSSPLPKRISPDTNDLAFIQFTSGSTSQPKGILITYRNLYANVYGIWSRLQVNPEIERFLSWLPLYHDMGLVGKFLGCLLTQTGLILTSSQSFARRPLKFMSLMNQYQTQICSMPNFGLEWILKRLLTSRKPACSLASMKWIGVGAEPVNVKTLKAFESALQPYGLRPGVLSPCYGLAEATLAATIAPPLKGYEIEEIDGYFLPTLGSPLLNIQVVIETDKSASGTVKIKGPSVAHNAIINGKVTSLLDKNGYYDTKDIGVIINGQLNVLGRADEMFILNGTNYFPYDIEASVRAIDGIIRNRVVCFHIRDQKPINSGVIILFESRPLEKDKESDIREEIERQVLASNGIKPSVIIAVQPKSIPVTPSGKLKRLSARQLYLNGYYDRTVELA